MIKLPNTKWNQSNTSDKFGNIAYSKNINLDEDGYVSLSPRSVNLFDDSENTSGIGDTDFDIPVAFGRYSIGSFRLATKDEPFNIDISDISKTITEDSSSNNPNLNAMSHGIWWQNRFHESTDTAVYYNTTGTWTANAITGLTSGKRHYMEVFKNRNTLCVTNGNVIKQYDTSYAPSVDLTLPSDFEAIGLAYNNYQMAIITRLGSDSADQNSPSYFFVWDGSTTESGAGVSIGSASGVSVVPYKSTFVVLTSEGQLLQWNGGGFTELASFPFYISEKRLANIGQLFSYGQNMSVDGDIIYINFGINLSATGKKGEEFLIENPSGVWCYDPDVGLYHKYSPSNSRAYFHSVTQVNVDTSTDTVTTSVTIPNTGSPMISTGDTGGITKGRIYYVIKVSSTTFKIADTYDNAMVGIAEDITSSNTINYFWLYDIIDYGSSFCDLPGDIVQWGTSRIVYRDVIWGAQIPTYNLDSKVAMFTAVPLLENRGHFVTSKIYPSQVSDIIQKVYIKHAPLDLNDKIVLKIKTRDYLGVPVSTPSFLSGSTSGVTWYSPSEGTTDADLSEAKALIDSGVELEIELTAGTGAGQMMQIVNITEESGTYGIELQEDIIGYTSGAKSLFVIDNWKTLGYVDYSTQKDGVYEFPCGESSASYQFKIELRGYKTKIQEIQINNQQFKKE